MIKMINDKRHYFDKNGIEIKEGDKIILSEVLLPRQMAKIKIAGQENSPGPLFFGSPKLQPLLNTKLFE